jgi:hypothetical protein
MSNSFSETYVTAERLRGTSIAMITVASLFCIARFTARWYKAWRFQAEDIFMLLAWAFFLSMSMSYVVLIPAMYRINVMESGKVPLYPTLLKDANLMIKILICNSMLFCTALWSVKFSLLFLYRRLMNGLPKQMRWWWAVTIFCNLVYITHCVLGAILTQN